MASVNRVQILGNVGQDPESRSLPSGDAVCNFSVATSERWKDKQTGEQREETTWHRISFFGRLAEIAGQYLRKGSQVYVEGSIHTRKYTDKDGVEKYSTEIKGSSLQLLDKRPEGDQGGQRGAQGGNDRGGYQDRGQGQRGAPAQQGRGAPQQRGYSPAARGGQGTQGAQPRGGSGFDDMDDDIPF